MTFGVDKKCSRCGDTKPLSEFRRLPTGHYNSQCLACTRAASRARNAARYANDPEYRAKVKARARQWEIDNPERKRARSRKNYDPVAARESRRLARLADPKGHAHHHRSSRYGITAADFDALVASQGGCCAICGNPFEDSPRIDHDHESGRLRALLCDHCNRGLGYFRDNAGVLCAAASYVERFRS